MQSLKVSFKRAITLPWYPFDCLKRLRKNMGDLKVSFEGARRYPFYTFGCGKRRGKNMRGLKVTYLPVWYLAQGGTLFTLKAAGKGGGREDGT